MQTDANIKQILDFYIQAGVDEVIGDVPVNQFDVQPLTSSAQIHPSLPVHTQASAKKTEPRLPSATTLSTSRASSTQQASEITEAVGAATSIAELKQILVNIEGFSLKQMATNTVFSLGNPEAALMIIDRAPSAEEDRTGQPFAGNTGIFLEKMLKSIHMSMDTVYLASCLPWRPPGGRPPTREEQSICLPIIKKHIELARPKHLLLCGEAAAFLLEKKAGINKLRGNWEEFSVNSSSIATLGIFHPTFLMAHPASKKLAWADLLKLKAALPS